MQARPRPPRSRSGGVGSLKREHDVFLESRVCLDIPECCRAWVHPLSMFFRLRMEGQPPWTGNH
jgi:hypothetical protein